MSADWQEKLEDIAKMGYMVSIDIYPSSTEVFRCDVSILEEKEFEGDGGKFWQSFMIFTGNFPETINRIYERVIEKYANI